MTGALAALVKSGDPATGVWLLLACVWLVALGALRR